MRVAKVTLTISAAGAQKLMHDQPATRQGEASRLLRKHGRKKLSEGLAERQNHKKFEGSAEKYGFLATVHTQGEHLYLEI